MTEPQGLVATLLETQARYCGMIGSRLYERLLELSTEDVRAGGPVWEALAGHAHDPPNSMLPLRLLGAVHRLVLAGEAPELARFYPSAGGEVDPKGAWPAFMSVLGERRERLEEEIGAHVQTNEVGRCAALLGGFLTVAERFRLPLALLEVGASAGLNLRWDRYLYRSGDRGFGPAGCRCASSNSSQAASSRSGRRRACPPGAAATPRRSIPAASATACSCAPSSGRTSFSAARR